jgi:hypothetical protein
MARQTLEQWIFEALNDQDKGTKCSGLALIHRVGISTQEIHAVEIGSRQWDVRELAQLFKGKADNYAAELVGVQTFNLLAFYGGSKEPQALKPFIVHGVEDFGGMATEGPTKDGLLQQMMRHTEAERQIGAKQVQGLIEMTMTLANVVVKENIALRQENREGFEMIKTLIMGSVENREAARLKELQYQRESAERQKWLSFAPAVINRVFGRDVLPESLEDTALIEGLAEKLTEEDFGKLARSGISPEVMGPFAARMAGLLEKKRKAQEQVHHAMNGADPELDATGLEPGERRLAS